MSIWGLNKTGKQKPMEGHGWGMWWLTEIIWNDDVLSSLPTSSCLDLLDLLYCRTYVLFVTCHFMLWPCFFWNQGYARCQSFPNKQALVSSQGMRTQICTLLMTSQQTQLTKKLAAKQQRMSKPKLAFKTANGFYWSWYEESGISGISKASIL